MSSASDSSQPDSDNPLAYETPDIERAASASPPAEALLDKAREDHDPYAAWRSRDFVLYSAAFFVSVIGGQIMTVAVGWEVYKRTNSAMSLGWLGLAMAAPTLLFSLLAGQLADTYSRRKILLVTIFVRLSVAIALAVMAALNPDSRHAVGYIYALLFVYNLGGCFGQPARSAMMVQLVPPAAFSNAVAWNSSMFETGSALGPAIGGLAVWLSIPFAYSITAAFAIAGGTIFFMLPDKPIIGRLGKMRESGFADLIAGVKFVFRSKMMLSAMTLDMFAVLLGGCVFVLPIFAKDILHVGPFGFGVLRAAPSVGAISTALFIAHRKPFARAGRTLLIAVFGFGVATIVFGLSRNYWLSFAALVVTGVFDNVSVVIRHSLVQLLTPDSMRGRVSAVNQVFIGSSNEVGGLESGLTAAWLGPVNSVILGGVGTVLVVIGVAKLWPQLRKLGSLQNVVAEEVPPPQGFDVIANVPAA